MKNDQSNSRLTQLFRSKKNILSIYLTAGFPKLHDTVSICEALEQEGVDLIEIGFPFSDPLADGPVIQKSSEVAIKNGMSIELLFKELREIRKRVSIPLVLMGYINPVLQFGVERFASEASACGIDGVILPDLPIVEFQEQYAPIFASNKIHSIFLVTQQTSEARLKEIDKLSTGFIYAVSAPSVTGAALAIDSERENYFRRLQGLKLEHPIMIGFGISGHESFKKACQYASGAIIGSAFIKAIESSADPIAAARKFIKDVRG